MKIEIKKTKNTPSIQKSGNNYSSWGEWGKVESQYSSDNTVDVLLDTGVSLSRVPVASKEWYIPGIDSNRNFNSGERNLPPVNARVFIFMPSFTFNDCFVAPFSGIYTNKKEEASPFMEDGKEKIRERITPSGWHITDDYSTGSHVAVSPDGETSLEVDYGNEEKPKEEKPELHLSVFGEVTIDHVKGDFCTLKIFDTKLVIKKGEVSIKPKETIIEVDGNITLETSGDTTVNATGDVSVKCANIEAEASVKAIIRAPQARITGGNLQIDGTAAPTGSGPFCGLPACLFTGALHVGNMVSGT